MVKKPRLFIALCSLPALILTIVFMTSPIGNLSVQGYKRLPHTLCSSLSMLYRFYPADCKINPKDEIFNPITSVMNDEMTVEEWAQNVEAAFAQVRADMEAAN